MLLHSVVNVYQPAKRSDPVGHAFEPDRPTSSAWSAFSNLDSTTIDSFWAFTSLSSAQQVFNEGDVVNTIELQLDDIYKAPEVAQAAEKIAGPKLVAKTWMEQFQQILSALNTEKVVTAVTIGLIQLVAALNILITLIMMVMEKNRDIAVLMSMGAKRQQIRKIFVLQGVLIGVVGTVIGLALGYSLSYPGGSLSLAASERRGVFAQLCAVQPALAGRYLDRRNGHLRQLHCDAVSGQKRHAHRAGGGAAVRVVVHFTYGPLR